MARPSIRGHQGAFKLYKDGTLVNVIHVTTVTVNQDSTMSRSFYVGNSIAESDQTHEGWSGSFETEVKDAVAEDFMDALINDNLNGIGVADYTFLVTENYPDGTTRTYLYGDCVFKMSRNQSGLSEKVKKSFEWQAAYRSKV